MTAFRRLTLVLCLALAGPLLATVMEDDVLVVSAGYHHLGDDETPEWPEAPAAPSSAPLEFTFEASARTNGPFVLSVHQRHVSDPWTVTLNGEDVATLETHEDQRVAYYPLPSGSLRDGANTLEFSTAKATDDVTLGDVRIHFQSLVELLDLGMVDVSVSDGDGYPVPARLTLVDEAGELPALHQVTGKHTAVRRGVVYTDGGSTRMYVPRGTYTVHASKGTEWSHSQATVTAGRDGAISLSLTHEVDTRGWVAADTHIHTVPFSNHGDANPQERVLTLAAEGVELAIATDHNHNTDLAPFRSELALEAHFTPVVGNEVSTPIGHFNAFPLDPDGEVPLHDSNDWVALVEDMRAKGALAVILNHPRWPAHDTGPFGKFGLDQATGQRRTTGTPFLFDAMELVNSTTDTVAPMVLFEDWFSLLNKGERVFAVGSSDSHTVGDPVGRGRTYVRSETDDVGDLDVDTLAMNIADGHSSVSLGIIVDVRVEGRSAMGHTVFVDDQDVDFQLRIAAPSWVDPERYVVWINGRVLYERTLSPSRGQVTDLLLPLNINLEHLHDAWVVVGVFGSDAGGEWWPGPNQYTLAASNPIFLDGDGDGIYESPREIALSRWKGAPTSLDLVDADDAVAIQYLELAAEYYETQARTRLEKLGDGFARRSEAIKAYLEARTADPDED
jgi:hypothetical protein